MKLISALKRFERLGMRVTNITPAGRSAQRFQATKTLAIKNGFTTVVVEFKDYLGDFQLVRVQNSFPGRSTWVREADVFGTATDFFADLRVYDLNPISYEEQP